MTMTEEIPQLLQNLRLRKMAAILESELQAARKSSPSYSDFLVRLLRAQWLDQQERKLQARIQHAHLPELWTLESFPFKNQPGVSRRQMQELAELEFIPKAANIIFIGPTGVGKTGLASGLLLKALQNGYRALFIKAQDLFDEMYASLADRASRKLVRHLARIDVLLVDELAYLNLRPEQTNIFFKLMEERYRRKATLITTTLSMINGISCSATKISPTLYSADCGTSAKPSASMDLPCVNLKADRFPSPELSRELVEPKISTGPLTSSLSQPHCSYESRSKLRSERGSL